MTKTLKCFRSELFISTGFVFKQSLHICNVWNLIIVLFFSYGLLNPLRPNNNLSQTSHCNIKGVSVSEVIRIENMITPVKFY